MPVLFFDHVHCYILPLTKYEDIAAKHLFHIHTIGEIADFVKSEDNIETNLAAKSCSKVEFLAGYADQDGRFRFYKIFCRTSNS